jgi:hypothetical protein
MAADGRDLDANNPQHAAGVHRSHIRIDFSSITV